MEASADPVESFRDGMTLQCCPELGERSGALPLWKGVAGCGLLGQGTEPWLRPRCRHVDTVAI